MKSETNESSSETVHFWPHVVRSKCVYIFSKKPLYFWYFSSFLFPHISNIFSYKDRVPCTIVAGGSNYVAGYDVNTVEIITGEIGRRPLSNLPKKIFDTSLVLHNGTIMLCGGL